jgi:hypothetical protein
MCLDDENIVYSKQNVSQAGIQGDYCALVDLRDDRCCGNCIRTEANISTSAEFIYLKLFYTMYLPDRSFEIQILKLQFL